MSITKLTKNRHLILIILFLVFWEMIRFFNIIGIHKIPTSSMEPNYEVGDYILSTCMIKPDYNSIITYEDTTLNIPGYQEKKVATFIGRIVGKGKDKLQIIDGRAFINGENIDKTISLKLRYKIGKSEIESNQDFLGQFNLYEKIEIGDSLGVFLDDNQLKAFKGKDNIRFLDIQIQKPTTSMMKSILDKGWTLNNFGPIMIPENHYFILGDNRCNSTDSRIRGFIHKSKVKTTIIN